MVGGYQIWIQRKYHTLVPTVPNPSFLPYQIRYINDSPLRGKPGHKNKYFNEENQVVSVEQIALEYYQSSLHYDGVHDEGKTLRK